MWPGNVQDIAVLSELPGSRAPASASFRGSRSPFRAELSMSLEVGHALLQRKRVPSWGRRVLEHTAEAAL